MRGEAEGLEYAPRQYKNFRETLWCYGKAVGEVAGCYKICLPPYMQQMSVGVMTEKGLSFGLSSGLANLDASAMQKSELVDKKSGYSKELEELIRYKNKLVAMDALVKMKKSRKIITEKEEILNNIIGLVKSCDSVRRITCYLVQFFHDEESLLKA